MSYINDALRKAQRERDGRYGSFRDIISAGPERTGSPRKRARAVGAAVVVSVLVLAGLILSVYVLRQSPPATEDDSRPFAGGDAVPLQPPRPETVPVSRGEKPVPPEADVWYKKALIAQRQGDLREARELYLKVLERDPENVKALNNLGVVHMGRKERDKAIAAFSRAVVLRKDYVDPYYNLACLYAQMNEIDESLWYLKVAMEIDGDVKHWVRKDADLKNVAKSPAFKKMMEGREN